MKRSIIFFVIVCYMLSVNAQNPLWKKVSEWERQSLPQSALKEVEKIRQEAIQNNDSPEIIKSWIYKIKYETAIDQDKLPEIIVEMENYNASNKNKVEQAFLYYVLAKIYSDYYQRESYTIRQRTAVSGYVPEDIREWSANNFFDRISEYVALSVQPAEELQKTDVLAYEAVLNEGKSSRELRPTAYDFLIYQGIDILKNLRFNHDFSTEIDTLYLTLISFRQQENNPKAILVAKLDYLDYNRLSIGDKEYLKNLEELKKEYAGYDYSVEILYYEALFYNNQQPINFQDEKSPEENTRKAYEICREGIEKYPDYNRIFLLKNLLANITQNQLNVKANNVVYPGQNLELNLSVKNLNIVSIEIYKIEAPASVYIDEWNRNGKYKKYGKIVEKRTVELDNLRPYSTSDTTISIPMPDLGSYEYVIYGNNENNRPANQQFSVSRLAGLSRGTNDQVEYLVVDRMTGKPVKNAEIITYKRLSDKLEELPERIKTNEMGLAKESLTNKDISSYGVVFGEDKYLIPKHLFRTFSYYETQETADILNLFTDRSIYRPGQTVKFKGIAYQSTPQEQKTIPGKNYKVSLHDANGKEIATKELKTNEFGSISGEFTLPYGLLNGYFSLKAEDGYLSFLVEEYKRPTFDIKFEENTRTYNIGDMVNVQGNIRSFSGITVQNTEIEYRVIRKAFGLFRMMIFNEEQIAQGSVFSDESGNFSISFLANAGFEDSKNEGMYYYVVETTATDSKGETQDAFTTITIGKNSMFLSFNLPDKVDKDELSTTRIEALNFSGNPVQAKGRYEIYSLKAEPEPKENIDMEKWETSQLVLSGEFESGKEIALSALKKQPSGAYRIVGKSKDEQGRDVENKKDFVLYARKDKKPPVPVFEWVSTPEITCEVGGKAEIIYGSSAKNVYVLYELFQNNQKIDSYRFELNNEIRKIQIPFLESYGDGVVASFTFIKEEKVFLESIKVLRKQPDKSLALQMEVFRDRLTPGQSEEWKISVKDAAKNPVVAELLAGMYDASLDKIQMHEWWFSPARPVYLNILPFRASQVAFGYSFASSYFRSSGRSERKMYSFDSFNWFGWNIYGQMLRTAGGNMIDIKAAQEVDGIDIADSDDMAFASPPSEEIQPNVRSKGTSAATTETGLNIRQNFDESAFFYPHLTTNSEGESVIAFTLPETNTTWKFRALAHTKDLHFGQLTKEVISQKKLMITPNIPRFIRESDKMSMATTISNLSEKPVSGKITIEFFDPNTNKPTIVIPDNSQNFTLEAGKTIGVTWYFEVPSGIDMTAVKIVAVAENFSDGEQHLIPVLPNRMLVTESLPLNVSGGKSKTFTFEKLANSKSSTLENYRLTLEFTSNPAWYAVQALPTLTNPQNEDVISWFSAFYGNSLARHLANSTPKVKQIIDLWTKQGGSSETLYSNLEKNQELKAALLEETPWIMQAKNETEQKQRLALLFDLNRISYQNSQALEKLKVLQTSEGGWSWFKGMHAGVSTTQWLLYGMGELERLQAVDFDEDTEDMRRKAIEFIDQKFFEHFENLKKRPENWKTLNRVSTYEIEYLLVRSLYPTIPVEKTKEASDFYLNILKKHWNKNTNIYDRAIAAIVLNRNGETKTAQSILKSLREHASQKPDLGMFWANNSTHAFMFQSATAVHTYIMDAFCELGASSEELDAMKHWLFKQKQVQEWESVPATVNAINSLLKTGGDWLSEQENVSINWGNKSIDTTRGEAGTGYIKESLDAGSFSAEMAQVNISKTGAGPAWGALYWQYFEDLDKISFAKTGLNVEKSLFVENIAPVRKELTPVNEANPIQIGDKVIVRLTVRADRDMEYVMLKDMRASCFEPVDQQSGMQWAQRILFYQSPKDASVNFYFHHLPKGTYVFEYALYATAPGDYSNGITTIQCLYAPEFVSHTSGGRVVIKTNQ